MILAFCTREAGEHAQLDDRFGRAAGFFLVDTDGAAAGRFLPNPAASAGSGAGTSAVQFLVNQGVAGIVAPHLGPQADEARMRMGIRVWHQGTAGTVDEALEAWRRGELEEALPEKKTGGLHRA